MRHPLAALTAGILLAAMPVLRASDEPPAALSHGPAAASAPRIEKIVRVPQTVTGPIPIGVEADVYCSGYLGETAEVFPGAIVSAEKEKNQTFFMQGDIVYIDIGERDGVQAGMEFTIVRPQHTVNKWDSDIEVVGRIYLTPGRVRVICAQERSSIAEITYGCADTQIGDFIMPFEPVPVPLVRRTQVATMCDVPNGKVIGHIVETRGAVTPRRDRLGRLPGPRRSRRPESRGLSHRLPAVRPRGGSADDPRRGVDPDDESPDLGRHHHLNVGHDGRRRRRRAQVKERASKNCCGMKFP